MFLFQVAHKHGSKKAPAVYAMLSDDAEKTVRSNFTKCQDISGSDMQATFDKYGVNKKDKKEMLKLIGELFAKNSEMVKILDEGNGVKAPEKYFDDYSANVKKWNDLVTKYGVSEWAQPEIVYFSSTKIDEIVVTADGPSNKKTSDDWYNTTGTVSGNYGKFGSYLDRISGGEWPDELKDVSLAKELVKYAIDNGRKEEAAQLISKYLDEFIASGDTKFFDDIFNKNPELKMQVLASRRDLSNYANYLSLMCKSLNVTIQDKSEDILLANPWINSLVMPGDREAAVVFMGALSALSNLGNKMNKFCEEFGRDFSMAVNRDFLVGGAGTVLTYLDKFLWGVHDELRSVFGFEASDNLTEANKNLTNSSSNVLLAIKQAEMSGYTFTTEMGLNLLCMVAPEFKFGSFAPKVASEFVKKEFAMGIFTDMVEFYMKEGYTREAAVEMAGNEFSSLSKTRVFDLVESSPKALWNKTQIVFEKYGAELKWIDGVPYFEGRPMITRDTRILDGVYVSASKDAPFLVIDKKYGMLNKLYKEALGNCTVNGQVDKGKILNSVYTTVQKYMKYDLEKAGQLDAFYAGQKVAIDVYLQNGVGVCKHQALVTGALLDMFKEDGFISGFARVSRNSTEIGGHAWVEYTNSGGEKFIIDVAQSYVGPVDGGAWLYARPK